MSYRCLNPVGHPAGSRSTRDSVEFTLRNGFPYSRRLQSHTSCINALTFSSGDGRFLASGGDDLLIKLWDFHQENLKAPSCVFGGPEGNIFSLEFSSNNRYLYAGGVCEKLFRYDASTLERTHVSRTVERLYTDADGNIRDISCHPFNEELCLVASEDGAVRRYDARSPRGSAEAILQMQSEITAVRYHPRTAHLFVTSDNRGHVCLRDERMSFGPSATQEGVTKYNTQLTKSGGRHLARPEVSSVCFDRDGEKLAVTLLHYLPTIYSLSDSNPLAVCSGELLPDGSSRPAGQRTYGNSCTMKHGNFGGPGLASDEFYGAGSDDFRGYLWRIPPIPQLLEQRKEISPVNWGSGNGMTNAVAFSEGYSSTKFMPKELSRPAFRLNGHRSIVNTVLFHPRLLHVVTAGVEKVIILHSPTPGSPCTHDLDETPPDVRAVSDHADEDRNIYLRSLTGQLSDDDRNEEHTIRMFDHILRVEGDVDIFETNRWSGVSDSSEDDDDGSDDVLSS